MTEPRDDIDRARADVDNALKRAEQQRVTGSRLARGWRQARLDNNFRAMIRNLAGVGEGKTT